MGREEQIEEREVLDSIFPNEITDVSETSYRVSIALDVPGLAEEDEAPTIVLTVSYPPDYPEVPPDLDVTSPKDVPKHPYFTLPDDTAYLLSTLDDTIAESLGVAMIFTLISTLKDAAEALINTRLDDQHAEESKERAKAEEAENAKFHGEAVTRESFLVWRERFQAEMRQREEDAKRAEAEAMGKRELARSKEIKMTGRELWEKGLVGKVEDDEEEEGRDALSGIERLKVAE
ncbi:hypothetical protein P7C71_g4750, partial [Lecanoromycetidae sp. Uapishka_2]